MLTFLKNCWLDCTISIFSLLLISTFISTSGLVSFFLFPVEWYFSRFRKVLAFVDSQLPLRFDATSLARVLALYQWSKLKEGAFRTKSTQVSFFHVSHGLSLTSIIFYYLVIILLNNGTAIAIKTTPNTIIIIRSVEMAGTPAPSTMTFRIASEAYVNGRNLAMSCMYQGIC